MSRHTAIMRLLGAAVFSLTGVQHTATGLAPYSSVAETVAGSTSFGHKPAPELSQQQQVVHLLAGGCGLALGMGSAYLLYAPRRNRRRATRLFTTEKGINELGRSLPPAIVAMTEGDKGDVIGEKLRGLAKDLGQKESANAFYAKEVAGLYNKGSRAASGETCGSDRRAQLGGMAVVVSHLAREGHWGEESYFDGLVNTLNEALPLGREDGGETGGWGGYLGAIGYRSGRTLGMADTALRSPIPLIAEALSQQT